MDPKHARAKQLFSELVDLPAGERRALLESRCADDPELRSLVLDLLRHHDSDDGVLHAVLRSDATSIASGSSEPPPECIDDYQILSELGHGGMGVVYCARHRETQAVVALKVMRARAMTTKFIRRFRREARILQKLQHPGIARFLDADTWNSPKGLRPYLVMELVEGSAISVYARTHAPSIESRLELLAQVCDIVHYAHEQGIVHRDLKPHNIFIDNNGLPRILDFGIARMEETTGTPITSVDSIVGTLEYMSPEQGHGGRPVDARADVFSLAVVGYELLTGKLPYERPAAGSPLEALLWVQKRRITPLGTLDPSLRGAVEAAFAQALRPAPDERYPTAAAFGSALRRAARVMALEKAKTVVTPPRRRRPALLLVAGLLVLGLVSLAGWRFRSILWHPSPEEILRQLCAAVVEADRTFAVEVEAYGRPWSAKSHYVAVRGRLRERQFLYTDAQALQRHVSCQLGTCYRLISEAQWTLSDLAAASRLYDEALASTSTPAPVAAGCEAVVAAGQLRDSLHAWLSLCKLRIHAMNEKPASTLREARQASAEAESSYTGRNPWGGRGEPPTPGDGAAHAALLGVQATVTARLGLLSDDLPLVESALALLRGVSSMQHALVPMAQAAYLRDLRFVFTCRASMTGLAADFDSAQTRARQALNLVDPGDPLLALEHHEALGMLLLARASARNGSERDAWRDSSQVHFV